MKKSRAKNKNDACQTLFYENEGGTTRDRQKWKQELERYSRKMYQDKTMRMKEMKELDEWEEESKSMRRASCTKIDHVRGLAKQSSIFGWKSARS